MKNQEPTTTMTNTVTTPDAPTSREPFGPIIRIIEFYFLSVMIAVLGYGLVSNPAHFIYDISMLRVGAVMIAAARSVWLIERRSTGTRLFVMLSMSGVIVNVPQPQCAYNASKAGVIQLTKSLAIEWATKGVRVNSISPGYIGTDLTLSSDFLKPLIAKWNELAPMGRLGKPEELQSICVYLAGDTAAFTTGSDFIIDGAFTCF